MTKPKAAVIDLDNCLAIIGDRDPMHGHLCHTDTLCEATALVVKALRKEGVSLVFLTGRNHTAHSETSAWLLRHLGVSVLGTALIMRSPDDWRPAAEYKAAMLDERILPVYDVVLLLDDDPGVIRMARARGIVAWQVREPLGSEVTG